VGVDAGVLVEEESAGIPQLPDEGGGTVLTALQARARFFFSSLLLSSIELSDTKVCEP